MALFTSYPAIDGIIALHVVSDYRLALKDAFWRAFSCLKSQNAEEGIRMQNFDDLYVIK